MIIVNNLIFLIEMGGGGSKNDIVKAVAQNTLQKAVLEQSQ